MKKKSLSGPFLFILGITFSGFLFTIHYTRSRDGQEVPILSPKELKIGRSANVSLSEADCECKSEKTGKKYSFCYKNTQNSSLIGKKFDCEHLKILEKFDLAENVGPFVNLSDSSKNEEDVVFVSAISDNHFNEAVGSLSSLRTFNPTQKYIIYGMDLSERYVKYFKTLRNVEYRVFNTSEYPEYVNNWMEYRFKPLILAEVMKEYANIWWMDAHISVKKPNMTKLLFEEIAVERRKLLDYFPTNSIDLLKSEQRGSQLGANTFYVARTEYTQKIFKW
uniref:Uncharacterized protein n=1 Tax=Caenorhabditis japonica TaxID=281687 RepID=A0A8R1DT22_CAEJA